MRLTGHVEQDEFTSQSDFVFDFSKTTVRSKFFFDVDVVVKFQR